MARTDAEARVQHFAEAAAGATLAIVSTCCRFRPRAGCRGSPGSVTAAGARLYAAAPAAEVIVSSWLRVFSKLLTMLTAWPVIGA